VQSNLSNWEDLIIIYQITKVLQQKCPVIVTAIVSDAFQWNVSTFWLLVIQRAIKNFNEVEKVHFDVLTNL
jgi:hypothetical protein